MMPRELRHAIAHAPYDVKNCDWLYALYSKYGVRVAIEDLEADIQRSIGKVAYMLYGPSHPQAVIPNLMALRRNG